MRQHIRKCTVALGSALIAVSLGTATPASADGPFVTPRYGMTCYTGTMGSVGGYQGYATCLTLAYAKWKVRVNCSYGFEYDSVWIYTSATDGWRTLSPATTCQWGVNWVQVMED